MKYATLFFDLDNTIWNFSESSELAIADIYDIYNIKELCGCSFQRFHDIYEKNNTLAWDKFELGLTSISELKISRFKNTFHELGLEIDDNKSLEINDRYLEILPTKAITFPETHEVLEKLKNRFKMHILSNGFQKTQIKKLKLSGLYDYFDKIITSENANVQKPNPGIIEFALNLTNSKPSESVYIGDNFNNDVVCAFNAGIDSIWVNRKKQPLPDSYARPTYIISSLTELMSILEP